VALVTLALVYGPKFYPGTSASERGPLPAPAAPPIRTPAGIAKGRGLPPAAPARAKPGQTTRPSPAATSEAVKQDKAAPHYPKGTATPAPAAEPEGVMVGPDGVTIRRVPDGDGAK
jgi:hypothetical protein